MSCSGYPVPIKEYDQICSAHGRIPDSLERTVMLASKEVVEQRRHPTVKAKQTEECHTVTTVIDATHLPNTCYVPGTLLYTLHLTFNITLRSLRIHHSLIHLFNAY